MIQRVLYIVCLSLLMYSCESTSVVSLEIKRPAEVQFKQPIKSIVFVDHATDQPNNVGHTLSNFLRQQNNQVFNAKHFHSLFVSTFEKTLKSVQKYDVTCLRLHPKKKYDESTPIAQEELNAIFEKNGADLVISLDRFLLESSLKLNYIQAENMYRLTYDASNSAVFNLYQKQDQMTHQQLLHRDSLYWENFDYTTEAVISRFPDTKLCLTDLVSHSVDELYKKLFLNTEIVQRTLYESTQSDMLDAKRYVSQNKWQEASYIWQYWYEKSKNNRMKAFCAANLALYSEISDNFDDAILWANLAKEKFESDRKSVDNGEPDRMTDYIKILKTRKEQVAIIKKQLDLQQQN